MIDRQYASYPEFQARGGALKKIAPSGGRREMFWVFHVKNHEFTPKNHIFSNCGGRREIFWSSVTHVRSHIRTVLETSFIGN
jgi:hypothetical protein